MHRKAASLFVITCSYGRGAWLIYPTTRMQLSSPRPEGS